MQICTRSKLPTNTSSRERTTRYLRRVVQRGKQLKKISLKEQSPTKCEQNPVQLWVEHSQVLQEAIDIQQGVVRITHAELSLFTSFQSSLIETNGDMHSLFETWFEKKKQFVKTQIESFEKIFDNKSFQELKEHPLKVLQIISGVDLLERQIPFVDATKNVDLQSTPFEKVRNVQRAIAMLEAIIQIEIQISNLILTHENMCVQSKHTAIYKKNLKRIQTDILDLMFFIDAFKFNHQMSVCEARRQLDAMVAKIIAAKK